MSVPALPPLPSLRAFEAAARLGSFSRAAAELHMSPAAVSYQVKQLEARLGLPLFKRFPRRVELTANGELLASAIIAAFTTMRTGIAQVADRAQDELSITTLPTVGASWLVPKLGRFRARHSAVRVQLDMSVPVADLAALDFDVAIRSGLGTWPGLRSDFLMPNLFTPVCSPAIISQASAFLKGEGPAVPLLGRRNWWQMWFGAVARPDVDLDRAIGTHLGAEHLYVSAAVAGHGIAMVSPIFFQREIFSGSLAMPLDLVASDGRGYWLTYPRTQAAIAKVRAFREWLLEEAAADVEAARPLLTRTVEVAPIPAE
ncbi:LysR substrate-binding domain-containing protein [Sphingosinicella sp. CPCC 101087]|uniref:LysR substrate-binding domain-containing protein n=1 Tax=Sphingosinicella sp. CPCC 101087 TaxID=2497754 RepID=UPI00101BD6E9|nr:LysR substrate-binding domain-containing protein [Sphingosinicella sp. CPCC 101087]